MAESWVHKVFFKNASEAMFAMTCRLDMLYCDPNFAKFSTRRIDDTYRTFSENMAVKWPGYVL